MKELLILLFAFPLAGGCQVGFVVPTYSPDFALKTMPSVVGFQGDIPMSVELEL